MKDIGDAAKFLHPDCAKENSKKGGPQQTSLKEILIIKYRNDNRDIKIHGNKFKTNTDASTSNKNVSYERN